MTDGANEIRENRHYIKELLKRVGELVERVKKCENHFSTQITFTQKR